MNTPEQAPEVRSFLDIPVIRKNIFNNVQEAITKKYPIENDNYALELTNLRYDGSAFGVKDSNIDWTNFKVPKKRQKEALLSRETLDVPLKGTWSLRDKLTNQIISQNEKVVARVPYMTERGTFIFRGNEYVTSHQQRLRPGIYTRVKENGEIEAHANLLPGTGSSFRMFMEPETGIFKFRLGQGTFPAYPVFKALGVNDNTLRETWGDKLLALNMAKATKADIQSFMDRVADYKTKKQFASAPEQGIAAAFAKMKIDPEVSQRTLGKPYDAINVESLLRITQKLLNINLKKEEVDDRDSQANLTTLGPEDIFAERIAKDAGSLSRNLLWKVTNKKTTQNIPSAYLSKQVYSALLNSGLSSALAEINPAEILDQINKVTRMGEGGLTSIDAIPDSARSVQPSQLGYIDVLRSPESSRIGVDTRAVYDVLKGKDGKLYRKLFNPKTNKYDLVNASTASERTIAFPGEFEKESKRIYALKNGKIVTAPRDEIDYVLPHGSNMFSHLGNIISSIGSSKGNRVNMGSRMTTQALPLDISARESPLVQSMAPDDQTFGTSNKSFEAVIGKYMGNVYYDLPKGGIVKEITPDEIKVLDPISKKISSIDIYNNFPLNQKSALNSTPLVKVGDEVKPGQLLAHSNFTDKDGVTALGTNLRVGYLPFEGNYEDAVVISESAAKKLSSEHMYVTKIEKESDELKLGKKSFMANYPSLYTKEQLDKLGDDGVIKPGQIVNQDDPLVIGTRMRKPEKGQGLFKASKSWLTKYVETWDKEAPGVVTAVFHDDEGVKVAVKSVVSSKIGDKLSGRYGNKGVISRILPDDQMPRVEGDKPLEIVFNPLGLISRVNPSMLAEVALAKVARKTGKPYVMESFSKGSLVDFALNELKKNNIPETETIFDPATNRTLKNIMTGEQFIMKLHHVSESKESARDAGVYTLEGAPAKGQAGQAKRVGGLEMNALVAHNVPAVIRDIKLVRGTKNDDFWRKFRMGFPASVEDHPFVYDKFLNMLSAAGIRVNRKPNSLHLMAMSNKDVNELAGERELENADTINIKNGEPVPGGLFDVRLTGGKDSKNRWAKITLQEPLPNPLMEEPIRRVLNMTGPAFHELLFSEGGPQKVSKLLSDINIDDEINKAVNEIKSEKVSKRDDAVKKLQYLKAAKENGIHPKDWMLNAVPVLPPAFRPVVAFKNMELTSDANILYKELFEANKNLKELKGSVSDLKDERAALYYSLKAVTGLGDPISQKSQEKNVAGMLTHIFGKSSPKFGMFQNKLISTTVDSVGRAAIIPDSTLDLDEVGIPENIAWEVYKPHIMRRLSKKYNAGNARVPLTELAQWVANKDPRAKGALMDELKERPVIISRAPVLHKFGIMGAKPVLVNGNNIRIPPLTTPGYGADFDGDTMNIHVPTSQEAIKEVFDKLLPSKNLLSENDYKVHILPRQEFLLGLYLATRGTEKNKDPKQFSSKQDAIKAFFDGKLNLNDPISILG